VDKHTNLYLEERITFKWIIIPSLIVLRLNSLSEFYLQKLGLFIVSFG